MGSTLFTPLEATVERRLRKGIVALRGRVIKIQDYEGWPDRLVFWPGGTSHFIECKRPKGSRFGPLQLNTHAKLRKMGFEVFVLFTNEQVDEYLYACQKRFARIST